MQKQGASRQAYGPQISMTTVFITVSAKSLRRKGIFIMGRMRWRQYTYSSLNSHKLRKIGNSKFFHK